MTSYTMCQRWPVTAACERTKVNESKDERWFCTEEEARAAGWRAVVRDLGGTR